MGLWYNVSVFSCIVLFYCMALFYGVVLHCYVFIVVVAIDHCLKFFNKSVSPLGQL